MAREEERRRLRRDLHDGLGPTLAGVVLQLDNARALVREDPELTSAMLAALRDVAQEAIGDVPRTSS
ncbi:MAG TPA: histidine kinase [Solirubrobacteraceae bacterium]|nr:histidine kinase [Solirubrobacteraceae bacterium]